MTRFKDKLKGFDAGENTGSNKDIYSKGREVGGVNVRDSQYSGVREGARNRKKARAERQAAKVAARSAEGKKVSARQQRLADEHQYNVDRQAEVKAGLASKKQAALAAKSESLKPGAKTDANPTSKKQQDVLDQYGFDPKGTPADMPQVDVTAGQEVVEPKSKKVDAYYTDAGGYRRQHTEASLKKQNREAKPTSQDVTWITNPDGSTRAVVRKNKGESDADFKIRREKIKEETKSDPNIT